MELDIPIDGDGTGFSWLKRSLRDRDGLSIENYIDNPIFTYTYMR